MGGRQRGNRGYPYKRPPEDSNLGKEHSTAQFLQQQWQFLQQQAYVQQQAYAQQQACLQQQAYVQQQAYMQQACLQQQAYMQQAYLQQQANEHALERQFYKQQHEQQQAYHSQALEWQQVLSVPVLPQPLAPVLPYFLAQQQTFLPCYPPQAQSYHQAHNSKILELKPMEDSHAPQRSSKMRSRLTGQKMPTKTQKMLCQDKKLPIAEGEHTDIKIKNLTVLLGKAIQKEREIDLEVIKSHIEDINKILREDVQNLQKNIGFFRSALGKLLGIMCNIMYGYHCQDASVQEIAKSFDFKALFNHIFFALSDSQNVAKYNIVLAHILGKIGELQEMKSPYVQDYTIDDFVRKKVKNIIEILKTSNSRNDFVINVILGVSKINMQSVDAEDINELFKLSIVRLGDHANHHQLKTKESITSIKKLISTIIKLKEKWKVSADTEIKNFLQIIIKYDIPQTQLNEKYSVSVTDIIILMEKLQGIMKFDDAGFNKEISDWIKKLDTTVREYKSSSKAVLAKNCLEDDHEVKEDDWGHESVELQEDDWGNDAAEEAEDNWFKDDDTQDLPDFTSQEVLGDVHTE